MVSCPECNKQIMSADVKRVDRMMVKHRKLAHKSLESFPVLYQARYIPKGKKIKVIPTEVKH
jgi:hypothetical protein